MRCHNLIAFSKFQLFSKISTLSIIKIIIVKALPSNETWMDKKNNAAKLSCTRNWLNHLQAGIPELVNILSIHQKWIVFSLLISTHKILNISESTILKFNYELWFIQSHYNVNLQVQVAMSKRITLTSEISHDHDQKDHTHNFWY